MKGKCYFIYMTLKDTVRKELVDPQEMGYQTYVAYITGVNDILRQRLRQFFRDAEIDTTVRNLVDAAGGRGAEMNYSLYNIGSDGRCEKGATSPHDVLLLGREHDLEGQGKLQETLENAFMDLFVRENEVIMERNCIRYAPGAHRVFADFEAKSLDGSDCMAAYKQRPNLFWPSRILDADPIRSDSFSILHEAKLHLAEEFIRKDEGRLGKKLAGNEKSRLKDHAAISSTGENTIRGERTKHFDLDEGTAHYALSEDISGVSQLSFKLGPLRLVQTAIVHRIITALRQRGVSVESVCDMLEDMQTQTTRKLAFLHSASLSTVSPRVIADLIDNYQYFLWLYHTSEFRYF